MSQIQRIERLGFGVIFPYLEKCIEILEIWRKVCINGIKIHRQPDPLCSLSLLQKDLKKTREEKKKNIIILNRYRYAESAKVKDM